MTTESGLVVQGAADGYLSVYDGKTGGVIHRINVGTGIMAAPMSYELDGNQYIAVTAGVGGGAWRQLPPWLGGPFPRKRIPSDRVQTGRQATEASATEDFTPLVLAPTRYRGTAAQIARGEKLFFANCARCHGGPNVAANYPDLWKMPPERHDAFQDIVLRGALSYAGMASFSDVLSDRDVSDIHAFIAQPAEK